MKIGIYAPFYYPFNGGAERVAQRVAHLLSEKHEVTVFTLHYDKALAQTETCEGVIIQRVPYQKNVLLGLTRVTSPQLLAVLEQAELDILHIHGVIYTNLMAAVANVMNRKGIPTVLAPHGLFEAFYGNTKLAVWQRFLSVHVVRFFLGKLFHRISYFALSSPEDQKFLRHFGIKKAKATIVYNGFELPIKNTASAARFREKYNIQSKVILLHVAHVKPNKGHDLVIQALPHVLRIASNLHYVAVGSVSGMWQGYAEALISMVKQANLEEHISFLGFTPDEDLRDAYMAADIVILPSLAETFPLSVLDGMAWGKAIIATDVGGVSHMITHRENGYLIPPNDVDALVHSILNLVSDPAERAQLGLLAYETVTIQFSWEQVIQRYEKINHDLLHQ